MKATLAELKHKINSGAICPYCLNSTVYVDSAEVYGTTYGMIYLCRPCRAWVGVHKGTNQSLGRLADATLRQAKKETHFFFDQIAKSNLINKIWPVFIKNTTNRRKAYLWLAEQLNIDSDDCHVGMFDLERCNEVIELCKRHIPGNG